MVSKTSLYQMSKYFMISCGLWKISFTTNVYIQRSYLLLSRIMHIIYCLHTMSLLIRMIIIATRLEESDNIFNVISVAIIILGMNIKIFIYINYGLPEMFINLIEDEDILHNLQEDEILEIYINQCTIFKNTSILQLISTLAAANYYIFWNMSQFPISSDDFMYKMWIPFGLHCRALGIFKIVICQFGCLINIAVHIALQSIISFVNLHLKILQIRLKTLFVAGPDNDDVFLKLGRLIQKHQFLIQFVQDLNNSAKSVIFLDYILESINLAAAMVQITTAMSIAEAAFSMVYFALLISQLYILAWSTNEINIQSLNVANAIYESNWVDQSEKIKKTLLIMLIRAQKPLSLTIGPFKPMNMEAGLMTLKGSYSYAGIMRQTYT